MITDNFVTNFLLGLVVVCNVAIGLLVYLRDQKNVINKRFFILASMISLWGLSNLLYIVLPNAFQYILSLVSYAAASMLAIAFYLFARVISGRHVNQGLDEALLSFGSIALLMSCVPNLIAIGISDEGKIITRPWALALYGSILVSIIVVGLVMILSAFKHMRVEDRKRIKFIAVGLLISAVIAVLFNLLLPINNNYSFTAIGPSGTLIFVLFTAYGIIRYQLFDIRLFVFRAIAYSFTLFILALAYIGPVTYVVVVLNRHYSGLSTLLISIIILTIAATNYHRFQLWVGKITRRIFLHDMYDSSELLSTLNISLAGTISLTDMLLLTSKTIEDQIKSEYCIFLIKREDVADYHFVGSKTQKNKFSNQDPLLAALGAEREKVIVTDLMPDEKLEVKNLLLSKGIAAVVQLSIENNTGFVGYMIIGSRKNGETYDIQDVRVVSAIGSTLVVSMQNALHYEEIQRFNETLQEKVEDATRKLRVTNEKLKRIDETKDEFISMASHQLRTPLTSVKGYVSMVLEGDVGPINDQQRQLLNQSFQSSQRMANLISDLLNLSRINTGKFVIDATPVDLSAIVAEEFNQLREMAEAKNINFTYEMPADFPTLMFDDGKMHQVVMNLMDNALYYTPSDGTVSVQLIETQNTIEFRVVDSGIGVPRDAQKFMFTKMYRADNARRARPDGTGLGLFLVKKVVAEQKGATIFETQEGKGSTFGFRFNKRDHLVAAGETPRAGAVV